MVTGEKPCERDGLDNFTKEVAMKKIILVNSSPRRKGNCAEALSIISENVNDAEVEVFNIYEKSVNQCLACEFCKSKDTVQCVQKDDMSELLSRLDACDALVVAAPVYFGMVNGPAKLFLDRIYPFFNPAKPNMSAATKFGKKVAIILTAGGGPAEVYAKHGEQYACFDVAGFHDKKVLSFNSAKAEPGKGIFSVEEDAAKIRELAGWLCE